MKNILNIVAGIGLIFMIASCQKDKAGNLDSGNIADIKVIQEQVIANNFKYIDLVGIWKDKAKGQFSLIKQIDNFRFTALYKPSSILAMEEDDHQNMNDSVSGAFKQKTAVYQSMHYINFKIQNETFKNELIKLDVIDNQDYYSRITYYSFAAKNEAYIVEDNDTLKCSFVNFERTYEADPSIMLTLAFSRKSQSTNYKNLKFIFDDIIFNKGKLIFNFDTQPVLLLNYLKPLS